MKIINQLKLILFTSMLGLSSASIQAKEILFYGDNGNPVYILTDVTINHEWQTIDLPLAKDGSTVFSNPVIVASPLSYNGIAPAYVSIGIVKAKLFQCKVEEWAYLDGHHNNEKVSFIVMEYGMTTVENKDWFAYSDSESEVLVGFDHYYRQGIVAPNTFAQRTLDDRRGEEQWGVTRIEKHVDDDIHMRITVQQEEASTKPLGERSLIFFRYNHKKTLRNTIQYLILMMEKNIKFTYTLRGSIPGLNRALL